MPKEGAPRYESVQETPLPEDIFDKGFTDDFDGDASAYAKYIAGKAESFLDSAADEKDWTTRLGKVSTEISDVVGGYETGMFAEREFLAEVLRRKMFPQKA
jgi:hypothetical protein